MTHVQTTTGIPEVRRRDKWQKGWLMISLQLRGGRDVEPEPGQTPQSEGCNQTKAGLRWRVMRHTKLIQAKGSREKRVLVFTCEAANWWNYIGDLLIFSHCGEWFHCGECKKNWTALFTWKICYTFDLYSLTAKAMGWSHNFPREKLSSDIHLRAEENLAILYPPSLLLDPWLKLGSEDHRLRWKNIFTGFSLFCFSDFHFCLTLHPDCFLLILSLCPDQKNLLICLHFSL